MATITASCDDCKKVITGKICCDDDGIHLCEECYLKEQIEFAKDEIFGKEKDIKRISTSLGEKKKELAELKEKLKAL